MKTANWMSGNRFASLISTQEYARIISNTALINNGIRKTTEI